MAVWGRTEARKNHGDYRNGEEIDRATIKVVAKADPKMKENGSVQKTGSVKDGNSDSWFRAEPKWLAQLEIGQSYEVDYSMWENLRFIRKITPLASPAPSEPPQVAQKFRQVAEQQRSAAATPPVRAQRHTIHPEAWKQMHISVDGAVNRAIQVGQVNILDQETYQKALQIARDSWVNVFGNYE